MEERHRQICIFKCCIELQGLNQRRQQRHKEDQDPVHGEHLHCGWACRQTARWDATSSPGWGADLTAFDCSLSGLEREEAGACVSSEATEQMDQPRTDLQTRPPEGRPSVRGAAENEEIYQQT